MQDCSHSISNAMKLLQFCTKPSTGRAHLFGVQTVAAAIALIACAAATTTTTATAAANSASTDFIATTTITTRI